MAPSYPTFWTEYKALLTKLNIPEKKVNLYAGYSSSIPCGFGQYLSPAMSIYQYCQGDGEGLRGSPVPRSARGWACR